jgi:hypothetical protein
VICNLERRGVRKRLRHAAIYSAALIVTVLFALDAPRAWRWVVSVPAFLTAIGFLQAATKTCVLFGAWGIRENPTTVVRIEDDAERRALLARSIVITAVAAAIGLALAALVVHA